MIDIHVILFHCCISSIFMFISYNKKAASVD